MRRRWTATHRSPGSVCAPAVEQNPKRAAGFNVVRVEEVRLVLAEVHGHLGLLDPQRGQLVVHLLVYGDFVAQSLYLRLLDPLLDFAGLCLDEAELHLASALAQALGVKVEDLTRE
jgi:hypothetical protein